MAKAFSKLLSRGLPSLRDPPIIPSSVLPIGARRLLRSGSTGVQVVEDLLRCLAGFMQEMKVRGRLEIGGHAGGRDEQVAIRGRRLAVPEGVK